MRLGKMLSVGEVVEDVPAAEPVAAVPEPAVAVTGGDVAQAPIVARASG